MPRFQPAHGYGFELSPEAVEGITAIVSTGVGLAKQGIEASAAKKQSAAQQEHDRKMAAAAAKTKDLELRIAQAQERAAASTRPAIQVSTGVPAWALGVGVATVGLLGVVIWRFSRKKAT
jgi:cobalamin biosynthesis Mg chelatase CobN